jgi:formylglycine-generating enzyme required for sulfatase activity
LRRRRQLRPRRPKEDIELRTTSTRTFAALVVALALPAAVASAAPPKGMVLVPAGTYEPLYKSEGVKKVAAYFLDEVPVTNAEFLDFVRANPKWRRSRRA